MSSIQNIKVKVSKKAPHGHESVVLSRSQAANFSLSLFLAIWSYHFLGLGSSCSVSTELKAVCPGLSVLCLVHTVHGGCWQASLPFSCGQWGARHFASASDMGIAGCTSFQRSEVEHSGVWESGKAKREEIIHQLQNNDDSHDDDR